MRFGDASTLADLKTLAPGQAYSESTSTGFSETVKKREVQVHEDYHKAAKKLDGQLGSRVGTIGPVESEMNNYNSGKIAGLILGAFGELSMCFHDLSELIASQLSAEHLDFYDIPSAESKALSLRRIRRSWGLAAHRGWAKLLLDRTRDLVEDPRQPRGPVHGTDEGDSEMHELFHFRQPPGGGVAPPQL